MKANIHFTKKPKLDRPLFIAAWPGMGEVSVKIALYLKDALGAQEFAALHAQDFFYQTYSVVKDSVVEAPAAAIGKFFYVKSKEQDLNDLIIFISQSQPDLAKSQGYCNIILDIAKSFNVRQILCFASMPLPIDYMQEPRVLVASTSKEMSEKLKGFGVGVLKEGTISGMNGLFLSMAKQRGLAGICFLGEIPIYTIQMENPKASLAILKVLSKILSIKFDFDKMIEEIKNMDIEIEKLLAYLKGQDMSDGTIKEEDVNLFKEMLSAYTKLPKSARSNIERLFKEAKENLKKAAELKDELDKWNVYKDFEDRFLDLFKDRKKDSR